MLKLNIFDDIVYNMINIIEIFRFKVYMLTCYYSIFEERRKINVIFRGKKGSHQTIYA